METIGELISSLGVWVIFIRPLEHLRTLIDLYLLIFRNISYLIVTFIILQGSLGESTGIGIFQS